MSLVSTVNQLSCSEDFRGIALDCPHRDSITVLVNIIRSGEVVLLKDRLIKNIGGLCSNCNVTACPFQKDRINAQTVVTYHSEAI
jgi:hypothetical protein